MAQHEDPATVLVFVALYCSIFSLAFCGDAIAAWGLWLLTWARWLIGYALMGAGVLIGVVLFLAPWVDPRRPRLWRRDGAGGDPIPHVPLVG
jgi:hypothetical protein